MNIVIVQLCISVSYVLDERMNYNHMFKVVECKKCFIIYKTIRVRKGLRMNYKKLFSICPSRRNIQDLSATIVVELEHTSSHGFPPQVSEAQGTLILVLAQVLHMRVASHRQ